MALKDNEDATAFRCLWRQNHAATLRTPAGRKEHVNKVENVIKIEVKKVDGDRAGEEEKRLVAPDSSLVEAWLGHL